MIRLKCARFLAGCLACAVALAAQESRLTHVSAPTRTGYGTHAITVGFVIGEGPAQSVLIRAIGPSLNTPTSLVNDGAANPTLTVFDHANAIVATNDDWVSTDAAAFARAGATPLPAGSRDAAVIATLTPGTYTALVTTPPDPANPTAPIGRDRVLVEIHALEAAGARLLNTSARLQIDAATESVVAFTVSAGPQPRRFLVRAAGPALAAFGVAGTLANPALRVRRAGSDLDLATNDDWSTPASVDAASAATLQAAFAQSGAFAFSPDAPDAALLVDLTPGDYHVHVADAAGFGGTTLVEIYDLSSAPTPREANLPATARAPALSSDPASSAVLAAVTPLPNHSADTDLDFRIGLLELTRVIELYNTRNGSARVGGYQVQSGTEDGFAPDASLSATAPAPALTRFHSADTNRDGRISLVELTRVIELYNFRTGSARTGSYYVTSGTEDGFASGNQSVVTIAATKPASDESGANPGEFTFTRMGDLQSELVVTYGVSGSGVNGVDYTLLPGTITIPAGSASITLPLVPLPDLLTDGPDTVVVTLTSAGNAIIGASASATVTIADSPTVLYVATLRPENSALDSIASGTATLVLSASETLAGINVSFSNLSSEEVSAHLRISPSGDFVAGVPSGQVASAQWRFPAVGIYTPADLLNALKSGRIYVGIDTARYPSGELKGTFVQGAGSQAFVPPPAPPAAPLVATTRADAARFLTQATFGPKKSEIDALTGQSIEAWLTAQLALPFTSHRNATLADQATFGGSPSSTNFNAIYPPNRQFAWFKLALTAPDQLRQRVAFALSQIFVVSDITLGNDNQTEPLANYYDLLGNGAFGNFRTLLENVTLSPMMGIYLSSLRNSKADAVAGTTPDENYAREVMQLFSIGLSLLQPDGTLKLDAGALPIPTYTQTTITEMAKVFTGWGYPSTNLNNFRTAPINYFSPMQNFPSFHDTTTKNIVNGVVIPPNLSGSEDLRITLDALFNHPNTGPFICRQLIQRLVTSNPSPAYVYRVAQKFADNGSGVRGDLSAVVRAIYTDYEARSATVAANQAFGKLKEPLLRLTNLLRSFNATSPNGRYAGLQVLVDGVPITGTTPLPASAASITSLFSATNLSGVQSRLAEAALRSPTVFNFFSPFYVEPGPLAVAGLVAPEFQITDATTSIDVPNFLRTFVLASNTGTAASVTLTLDLAYEQTLVSNPTALLDHVATLLAGGALPATTRDRFVTALAALPTSTAALDRARTAVLLVATSPAGATQK